MNTGFKFTEIMAVYNVEAYLEEALSSLYHQTIGFENIQIILVDDGSTDSSGTISDQWAERYPQNVLSLHKPNGGQASARNMGLQHASGEYVSFLDPDDKLSEDALERVYHFYEQHREETDIVSIPLFFFGSREGEHILNTKYADGTRVIDLLKEHTCIQLSCSASFYPLEAARGMSFDPALATGEDAKENLKILVRKPVLGVVSEAKYWYRRHTESTVAGAQAKPAWYTPYLHSFSEWALDYSEKELGYVPKFVQYTVMYDLQWKILQTQVPEPLQAPDALQQYKHAIDALLARIDPEIVLQMESLSDAQKYMVLRRTGKSSSLESGDHELQVCFGQDAGFLFEHLVTFEVCFVTIQKDLAVIEGLVTMPTGLLDAGWSITAVDPNGTYTACALHEVPARETFRYLDETICDVWGFRAELPTAGREGFDVSFQILLPQGIRHGIACPQRGHYLPVCPYPGGSGYQNGWQYSFEGDQIRFLSCRTTGQKIRREISVERMLVRMRARKALFCRWLYLLLKPFFRREIWLVTDRLDRAGDNGEAFFRYLVSNPPGKVRPYFVISRETPDYQRMKAVGPTIAAHSFPHKMLTMMATCIISSGGREQWFDPFGIQSVWNKDILYSIPFFFLQHGIIKDDLSKWLNRWSENIQGFVTSAVPEHRSIVEGAYDYPAEQVWLTGLPRYDRLEKKQDQKRITIMPTWRKYLMGQQNPETGQWSLTDDFKKSAFCTFYSQLLSHPKLLKTAADLGYEIQFMPHPNMLAGLGDIAHDETVVMAPDKTYAEVFMESSVLVTDYSSVAFDFVYLRKPVVYFQFDSREFFGGSHAYEKGYFDYERDGFGPVCYDLETVVSSLIDLMQHQCALRGEYADRVNRFFSFSDQKNSSRVAEHIVSFLRSPVD